MTCQKSNAWSVIGIQHTRIRFHIGIKKVPCAVVEYFKTKVAISLSLKFNLASNESLLLKYLHKDYGLLATGSIREFQYIIRYHNGAQSPDRSAGHEHGDIIIIIPI